MDAPSLQVSILTKILSHFLNLDFSDVLALHNIQTSSLDIHIIPPSTTNGLFKVCVGSPSDGSQPQDSEKSEDNKPPTDPKRKRGLPPKKKYSKVATTYKSGVESEDEERRIHRKIEIATTINNIFSDYEVYCRNHLSVDEMLQSKEERYKAIPSIGFAVYISTLKSITSNIKTLRKDDFNEWEIKMLNRLESPKYSVKRDDIDMITQGQNIYYSNTLDKNAKTTRDQFIQAIKTPLLSYVSAEKVIEDFFSCNTNFIGCLHRNLKTTKGTLIYQLESSIRGVKQWNVIEDWQDFIMDISSQLSSYMASLFRDTYYTNYKDNTYRENFNSIPELNILFENIKFTLNYRLLDHTMREIIGRTRVTPEIDSNKFDTYSKEKFITPIGDMQTDIKTLVLHQMFDEIPDNTTIM